MPKKIDLTGQVYTWLTVLHEHPERRLVGGKKVTQWVCQCKCGNITVLPTRYIRERHSKSCGCMPFSVGNMSSTRPYRIWHGMKERCRTKNNSRFKYYGARGISYDPRWEDFNCFWEDMKDGYSDHLTLDRKDNNEGYCKGNCRWATQTTQVRNKRNTRLITYKGETKPLIEWAEEFSLSYAQLTDRAIRRNWSPERALTQPLGGKNRGVQVSN